MSEKRFFEEPLIKNKKNWEHWYKNTKSFLELTSDIIVGLTLDYQITEFNSAAEHYYTWKKESILGKNFIELCCAHNHSLPILDFCKKNTPDYPNNAERKKFSYNIQWTFKYLYNERSDPFGLMLIGKLPRSNSFSLGDFSPYFDLIIDMIPGSFYIKDQDGIYVTCNQKMLSESTLKSKADIIGKTDFELWPDLAEKLRINDLHVIETGEPLEVEENVMLLNGSDMYFISTKMPIKDEYGRVIGIAGNSIDISLRKQMEKNLKIAKESAELSNQLKTEFLRNMEHDIRTPLSGIFGLSALLHGQETDVLKKETLFDIMSCSQELLGFFDGVLALSTQLEKGALPLSHNNIDLKSLLQTTLTAERPAATLKKIELIVKHDERIPRIVVGDYHRLQKILINLVSNAIKFTHTGYVRLTTRLFKREGNNLLIRFIIEDTGIGIPQDKQSIIFEKFSRVTESNKNIYDGTGLGLFIVKQFLEELGGKIKLKSELTQGSTFTCTIPLQLSSDQ